METWAGLIPLILVGGLFIAIGVIVGLLLKLLVTVTRRQEVALEVERRKLDDTSQAR